MAPVTLDDTSLRRARRHLAATDSVGIRWHREGPSSVRSITLLSYPDDRCGDV
jgi:hypothetical protein